MNCFRKLLRKRLATVAFLFLLMATFLVFSLKVSVYSSDYAPAPSLHHFNIPGLYLSRAEGQSLCPPYSYLLFFQSSKGSEFPKIKIPRKVIDSAFQLLVSRYKQKKKVLIYGSLSVKLSLPSMFSFCICVYFNFVSDCSSSH